MKIGIYPGTFDPLTNGHLDIIERGSKLFDELYVIISNNLDKKCLFSASERAEMIKEAIKHLPNVKVQINDGLTIDCARQLNAKYMLRGLRAISDFEYELSLYSINKALDENIETLFIMSSSDNSFISSSYVKGIAKFGGNVDKFVPKNVARVLKEKKF